MSLYWNLRKLHFFPPSEDSSMFDGPLLHPYSIVSAQLRSAKLTPEERKVLDEQLLFYPGLKIPDPPSDLPIRESGT